MSHLEIPSYNKMKWIRFILGSVFTFLFSYLIGMQVVQILYMKKFEFTFDFSLLFFDGKNIWFYCLTLLASLISLSILFTNMFDHKERKAKNKDDKINFSKLSSIHQAKKGLLRLECNGQELCTSSPLITLDKILNPTKKMLNQMMYVFKVGDIHKFNTIKKWNFNGETVCQRGGLPIYTPRLLKRFTYVDPQDTHSIIIGSTGSGKTESVLLSMISIMTLAGESMIITDPKGELYKKTAYRMEKEGYDIHCLNFIQPEFGNNWNPFDSAIHAYDEAHLIYEQQHKEWELKKASLTGDELKQHLMYEPELDISAAIEHMDDIANILTYDKDAKDKFWNESAAEILVGFALMLLLYAGKEYVNATNIMILANESDTPIDMKIKKEYNIKGSNLLSAFLELFVPSTHQLSLKLSSYANASSATAKSIRSVLTSSMRILTSNEQIRRMTSYTDFKFDDLENKKTAIFLIIHDEKKTYHSLVTLFVKQLYEEMIAISRQRPMQRLNLPLNVILEEAGSCPPIKDIDSMLSAARSRGIRFFFALQAYAQFVELYGKETAETIESNCTNTIFLMSSNDDTLKKMSELCGKHQVWVPSRRMYESRPLITPDRLQHLNMGEEVIHRQRKNALITRLVPYTKSVFYEKNQADFELAPPKEKVHMISMEDIFQKALKNRR